MNPKRIHGNPSLAQRYDLFREIGEGLLQITEDGSDSSENPGGDAEARVFEAEGFAKLMSIVADSGPSRRGRQLAEWADYLERRSNIRARLMTKDTMRRRLANLVARDLVERKGTTYSATSDGLPYLQRTKDECSALVGDRNRVWDVVRQNANTVRESLRSQLPHMDSFAFQRPIKRLLKEMDYQNVEITSPSSYCPIELAAEI